MKMAGKNLKKEKQKWEKWIKNKEGKITKIIIK